MPVNYVDNCGQYLLNEEQQQALAEKAVHLPDSIDAPQEKRARLSELIQKIIDNDTWHGFETPPNVHLSEEEHNEFSSLLREMKIEHFIRSDSHSMMCTPPTMYYTIYDLPMNKIEAVRHAIGLEQERCASNGATAPLIGGLRENAQGHIGVSFQIDEEVELSAEHGYPTPQHGVFSLSVLQRTPKHLCGFPVVDMSEIGPISLARI
jgi:hypothetical protein